MNSSPGFKAGAALQVASAISNPPQQRQRTTTHAGHFLILPYRSSDLLTTAPLARVHRLTSPASLRQTLGLTPGRRSHPRPPHTDDQTLSACLHSTATTAHRQSVGAGSRRPLSPPTQQSPSRQTRLRQPVSLPSSPLMVRYSKLGGPHTRSPSAGSQKDSAVAHPAYPAAVREGARPVTVEMRHWVTYCVTYHPSGPH